MQKEKLRSIRKKKGYTQQQIADVIATDVSNYSRKESGDVRIIKEEWEKIANFLEIPMEEIYEDEEAQIVVNNDHPVFNDSSASGVYQYNNTSIPFSIVENLQEYISLLKEEIKDLQEEIRSLKSKK
ncbi:transcriptional regulator with XRE-family HTH domain [Chryseobacterium defluvii]|uniref:Transcriptional regulator with XRE-family HTH domain n=1 Tax=Chryseobacterium defluvii TaxID=160396 RepID=A0A840KFX6_9FLAO|nr:helix-turn-helix transcriptional regulator [Chryseobacterium defluvii]MBB4806410.1 transcriptional regulator with XRE-family HTH domain [Chryseobacterium defluvii]